MADLKLITNKPIVSYGKPHKKTVPEGCCYNCTKMKNHTRQCCVGVCGDIGCWHRHFCRECIVKLWPDKPYDPDVEYWQCGDCVSS